MRKNKVSTDYSRYGSKERSTSKLDKTFLIIAMVLLIVGTLCVGVGVGLPVWLSSFSQVAGLFQACTSDLTNCVTYDPEVSVEYKPGVYLIPLVWGLILSGCLCLLIALFCLFGYVCYSRINHCKMALAIATAIFIFLAVVGLLSGMSVFLDYNWTTYNFTISSLDYAFYITASGILLLIVGAICFGLHSFFLYKYTAHNALH